MQALNAVFSKGVSEGPRLLERAKQPDIVILIAPLIVKAGMGGDDRDRAWQIAVWVGQALKRLDSECAHGCSGVGRR
jgi:hypothetical protein